MAKRAKSTKQRDDEQKRSSRVQISRGSVQSDSDKDSVMERVNDDERRTRGYNIFSPSFYQQTEIPEERIDRYIEHEDGSIEPVYVKPKVIRPWVCEYYHAPTYKVRLIVSLAFILMFLLLILGTLAMLRMPNSCSGTGCLR